MNHLLSGIETALKNDEPLTKMVRQADIKVVGDPDVIPPGVEWPYVVIKDGGIETLQLVAFQKEEFMTGKIFVVHRSYEGTPAAQLLNEEKGAIAVSKRIIALLEDDWNHQFALSGFYLGPVPVQINRISGPFESEPFTPKGTAGTMDRVTSRIRIDARYYRYSTREVAIA